MQSLDQVQNPGILLYQRHGTVIASCQFQGRHVDIAKAELIAHLRSYLLPIDEKNFVTLYGGSKIWGAKLPPASN